MAKYSRFDPRNRKYGRNKSRSLEKELKIRDAETTKNIHKYKGTRINWIVDDVSEVDEDTDTQVY